MRIILNLILFFSFVNIFAEEKNIVFADKQTQVEYTYFQELLNEFEEGTDSFVEIEFILNNEFIRIEHPDYIELKMSEKLLRFINGEGDLDED